MLDFEVQTTPIAANVLHAWSHDIGGFHPGNGAPGTNNPKNWTEGELYLRWIQAGAVFPVMRTHTTKEGKYNTQTAERRIWEFPQFVPMRDAFYLRAAFVPYVSDSVLDWFSTTTVFLFSFLCPSVCVWIGTCIRLLQTPAVRSTVASAQGFSRSTRFTTIQNFLRTSQHTVLRTSSYLVTTFLLLRSLKSQEIQRCDVD